MKRYLLFAGRNYYPSGGWDDFVDSFELAHQAAEEARSLNASGRRKYDWSHIVDMQTSEKWDVS